MARALACLRYLLVTGTIILAVSGIAAAIFAAFFLYQLHEYGQLTPDNVCNPSAILCGLGVFTCFLGWFAWQFLDFTHKAQVTMFAASLALISFLEISTGIWAVVRHEQIDSLPMTQLKNVLATATKEDKPLWDHMQAKFRCCGVDGPSDYRDQESIPWSCCDVSSTWDSKAMCSTIHTRGCHHVMINRTRSILLHIFLVGLCSASFKVALIVGIGCYIKAFADEREKRLKMQALTHRLSIPQNGLPDNTTKLLNRQSSYLEPSN